MRLEGTIYNYIVALLEGSDNELPSHSINQHFSFRSLMLAKHIPNVTITEPYPMLRVFKYPLLSPISLATTSCSLAYNYLWHCLSSIYSLCSLQYSLPSIAGFLQTPKVHLLLALKPNSILDSTESWTTPLMILNATLSLLCSRGVSTPSSKGNPTIPFNLQRILLLFCHFNCFSVISYSLLSVCL